MKKMSKKFFCITIFALSFLILSSVQPNNSLSGSISIYASSKPAINKKKIKLVKGQKYKLKVKNASGKIKWSSTDKKIVKVSSSGRITAKKAGKATVIAKIGSKKCKCVVTVEDPKINYTSLVLERDDFTYKIEVTGTTFEPSYSSSAPSIVYVSKDGQIIPMSEGDATILIEINEKVFKCQVKVKPLSNKKLTVNCSDSISMDVGSQTTIYVTVDKGAQVSYSLSQKGCITAQWGEWEKLTIPLTIEATDEGTTTLTIYDTINPEVRQIISVTTKRKVPLITCDNKKTWYYPNKKNYGIVFRLDDYSFKAVKSGNIGTYNIEVYVTGECVKHFNDLGWGCTGKLYDSNGNLVKSCYMNLMTSMHAGDKLSNYKAGILYDVPYGEYTFQFNTNCGVYFGKDSYLYNDYGIED